MSLDSALSQALTVRLNLQVSLSALPFVEESMDVALGEWLDSVPLPPESAGRPAQFLASIGADIQRLRWSAAGSPTGFIPKLSDYLTRAKVSPGEIEKINVIGGTLEPETIGSWIEVRGGQVFHGWQLLDREDASEVLGLLGEEAAEVAKVIGELGLSRCTRVARVIDAGYRLDFELTGAPAADALSTTSAILKSLGSSLVLPDGDFVNRDVAQTTVVAIVGDAGPGVAAVRFGAASDQAAAVANAVGATYSADLDNVRRALSSAGVVGACIWAPAGDGKPLLDVDFVPGTQRGEPRAAN